MDVSLIDKMQRHMHFYRLGHVYPEKIQMQYLKFCRITLNTFQNCFLCFSINSDIQYMRINRLMLKMLNDFIMT